MREAVRLIIEETLEAEVSEELGRGYYERALVGGGQRNGYREGRLVSVTIRAGALPAGRSVFCERVHSVRALFIQSKKRTMQTDTTHVQDGLRSIDFKAALLAGLVAGIVDRILLVTILSIQGHSVWGASRLVAAIVLGPDILVSPATYDLGIVIVSLLVHFGLSLVYGLIIAALVHRLDWYRGLMVGVAIGFAIYLINYYVIAPLVFPWALELRGPVETLIHPVFGTTAAAVYLWLRKPRVERSAVRQ